MEKQAKTAEVVDELGRKIVLRKPSRIEFGDFLAALGSDSSNEAYLGWMLPCLFVFTIDGEMPVPPENKKNIRAIMNELGDEGHAAALEGINTHFPNFLSATPSNPEDLKKKSTSSDPSPSS